jgi:gentisate 1,2-dioxygenase
MIDTSTARTDDDRRAAWNAAGVAPLWENALAHNGTPQPKRPGLWPWRTMKPLVDDAASLTSTGVVERRVLSLMGADSQAPGYPFTVTNLNAGFQILLPGEAARPHRHSMNALRFVIDGTGANTVVDGKPCPMSAGDLILTPGWTWHEHVHSGEGPIVWLDVLDASLHRYLGTDDFEPGPPHHVPARTGDDAFAFANLLPDSGDPTLHSPVFRYPWSTAVAAVSAAPRARDGARRIRYINPATGGATMSLLDCTLMQLDAGQETLAFRTSSHSVCAVVEGSGSTTCGDTTIAWGEKDVFALPNREWVTHRATGRARIFVTTDREILRRLDLLEERYRDPGESGAERAADGDRY